LNFGSSTDFNISLQASLSQKVKLSSVFVLNYRSPLIIGWHLENSTSGFIETMSLDHCGEGQSYGTQLTYLT